jgi:hypothetical protein
MAGQPRSSTTQRKHPTAATNARTRKKREARSKVFRELVRIAADQGAPIVLGVTTADAMQECLDRAVALFRFAASKVDELSDDDLYLTVRGPNGAESRIPHQFVEMETEARLEIEKLAAMMTQLGIAERTVRIEEAKAALVIAAIRDAAIDVGLDNDQIRLLGQAIRTRIEAASASMAPHSASAAAQDPATSAQVASLGPGH